MKIRSITLDNVRRFADPVSVGPIGDGVTLLCEANESGKSTLFDALRALFFVKYSGWPAEVSSLQPHSGGKVAVTVELELDGAMWRVRKQWQKGAGGEARVWRDGQLRHQGDEAEHWLSGVARGDGSGPSGLLWVRQGRVSLSVDGKYSNQDTRGDEHEQRRNLLTLITGAMDDLTGGQTMDAALDTCMAELAALQTGTGKPRTGGAWSDARKAVEDLEEREAHLSGQADELHDALQERRSLTRDLAALEDTEVRDQRIAELAEAEAAFKDAERHASLVAQARSEAALARQTFDRAEADAKSAKARRDEHAKAGQAAQAATEAAEAANARLDAAEAAWDAAREAMAKAEAADAQARDVVQRVTRRDAARAAGDQRKRLAAVLAKAEDAEKRAAGALARAASGPKPSAVDKVEALAQKLETARAVRDAAGTRLSIRYDAAGPRISVDGTPLDDGASLVLTGRAQVDLPGIGEMVVTPADDGAADPVQVAETALNRALEASGHVDLAALRTADRQRAADENAARLAQQERDALAPDGLQALRNELAALPTADEGGDAGLPSAEEAEAGAATAARTLATARETEAETRTRRDTAKDTATEARTRAGGAAERLDRARLATEDLAEDDPQTLADRLETLRKAAETAELHHAEQSAAAPNVAAAEAKLSRIRAVIRQADQSIQKARERRAALRALIDARAEEGVEEALENTRALLADARDRLERIVFEVDVLRRLSEALQSAQSAARDKYYGPIATELRPLLEELWDDAELVWSDETLLPSSMIRKGETEPINTLSGGTQEQIALLVRLAFARLLAKSGRHAPLILDDALVYSDDDRIESLFNALHTAASDLQIIVLSCRQRAFRDLGANQVEFTPVAAGA